jgi:hypothetical protein
VSSSWDGTRSTSRTTWSRSGRNRRASGTRMRSLPGSCLFDRVERPELERLRDELLARLFSRAASPSTRFRATR